MDHQLALAAAATVARRRGLATPLAPADAPGVGRVGFLPSPQTGDGGGGVKRQRVDDDAVAAAGTSTGILTSTSTPMTSAAVTGRSGVRSAAKVMRDAAAAGSAEGDVAAFIQRRRSGGGLGAERDAAVAAGRRALDKENDGGGGDDGRYEDEDLEGHVEGGVRRRPDDLDASLVNSYDAVNLVRSDLIREFESRGVRLAHLEREVKVRGWLPFRAPAGWAPRDTRLSNMCSRVLPTPLCALL